MPLMALRLWPEGGNWRRSRPSYAGTGVGGARALEYQPLEACGSSMPPDALAVGSIVNVAKFIRGPEVEGGQYPIRISRRPRVDVVETS